jgi:hypothetical protein
MQLAQQHYYMCCIKQAVPRQKVFQLTLHLVKAADVHHRSGSIITGRSAATGGGLNMTRHQASQKKIAPAAMLKRSGNSSQVRGQV